MSRATSKISLATGGVSPRISISATASGSTVRPLSPARTSLTSFARPWRTRSKATFTNAGINSRCESRSGSAIAKCSSAAGVSPRRASSGARIKRASVNSGSRSRASETSSIREDSFLLLSVARARRQRGSLGSASMAREIRASASAGAEMRASPVRAATSSPFRSRALL